MVSDLSLQSLVTVMEQLVEGVAIFDGNDHLAYLNSTARAFFDDILEPGAGVELQGRSSGELLDRLRGTDLGSGLEVLLRGEGSRWDAITYQSPAGRTWDISLRRTEDGVFATFRDTTIPSPPQPRIRLDPHSRRMLDLVQQAIQSMDTGVTIADALAPDQPLIFVNDGFTRITGYEQEEAIGANCRFLQGSDTDQETVAQIREALGSQEGIQVTLRNYRKDGSDFWNRLSISPVRDESGEITHYIGIQEDVTEHRRMGRQIGMADRLNTVGSLAGGIAHDMRNVLASAKLLLQLVLDREELSTEAVEDLREADEVLSRGESVTSQLLAFAREQPLETRAVDMGAIVRDRVQFLRRFLRDDIAVVVDAPHDLFTRIDEGRLDQVIFNLATNAEQAMPNGGELRFELGELNGEHIRRRIARFKGKPEAPFVVVSVTDTGDGMDEEVKARAFDPFFTGHPETGGTGLGLASVFGTMDQFGGAVWIESSPGDGTTVRLAFPRIPAPENDPSTETEPFSLPTRSLTILLVEDESSLRRTLSKALSSEGHDIIPAADGEAARVLLESRPSRVDLIVSDIMMPGMTGVELAEFAQQVQPDLPILLLSGYSAQDLGHLGRSVRFLSKPFELPTVLAMITAMT